MKQFLLVFCLFLVQFAIAQNAYKPISFVHKFKPFFEPKINLITNSATPVAIKLQTIGAIPANAYTLNFGFFCKKELMFEKRTKIPLRFRLGSLAHCNYLEGKK